MINLAISLAAGALVTVAVTLFDFSVWAGLVPGVLVMIGLYIVLGRRTFNQMQAVAMAAQAELQSLNPNNKREQQVKVEKALKLLEGALPLGRWQFLVESQLHGQIGQIKYLFKDLDGAMASFAKVSSRDAMSKAMQGALYFQRKDFAAMEKCFEDAVTNGKKEGLLWAAYAWCLVQNKEQAKALKVLSRAVEANPNDEKLKRALTALQNDKRLKMDAWTPMWWQLGLEAPTIQQQVQFVGGANRRRMLRGR